jgi:hypothetical protein
MKLLGFEAAEIERGEFYIVIQDGKVRQAFTMEVEADS